MNTERVMELDNLWEDLMEALDATMIEVHGEGVDADTWAMEESTVRELQDWFHGELDARLGVVYDEVRGAFGDYIAARTHVRFDRVAPNAHIVSVCDDMVRGFIMQEDNGTFTAIIGDWKQDDYATLDDAESMVRELFYTGRLEA